MLPLENLFCMSAFIIVLIQLFSSFGKINGIELPLELLREGSNTGKSIEFPHRITFPLQAADNGVNLPPNVEDNMELQSPKSFDTQPIADNVDAEYEFPVHSEMPKWLKMQLQPETEQHVKYHHSAMLPKRIQFAKHHHDSHQLQSSTISSPAASPLKRCSIEISSKIPGICQVMGSIGNACVSGDYIDVFNVECL